MDKMKEFHAKGMEPSSRKKAKPSSTKTSLGSISKRADSFKIVRSRKSSPSLRRKLVNGMENMCCKNCGDMFGKPTKENKSCMYNAYDPKGENWTEAKKIRITPKMQRRALASKSAQAKPKSQVSLKKAPWDKKKEQTEAFDFKVNIDGFPEMFMSGNSPGEVKTHLRKLIKQPSMIQSVDRVTKHDKKKHHRDKVNEGAMSRIASTGSTLKKPKGLDTFKKKPKEQKEKTSGKVDYGSDESIKMMKKKTPGEQNEQNRFTTMVLPSLQKAKNKLANIKKSVMGTNPTGNQQRKKYVPGIRQNIRNK